MANMLVRKFQVLELYSGIGGMHYALSWSGIHHEVVEAYDVSTVANHVYSHNLPHTPLNAHGIECLTAKKLTEMDVDMITMSPPCQPFTRVGKQRDDLDPRSKSFLHFLTVLSQMAKCPRYLLMENVAGFEKSSTHDRFVQVLADRGYHFQELLLTPLQFGIPNSRLRYFLIASLTPLPFDATHTIAEHLPLSRHKIDENFTNCLLDDDITVHDTLTSHENNAHLTCEKTGNDIPSSDITHSVVNTVESNDRESHQNNLEYNLSVRTVPTEKESPTRDINNHSDAMHIQSIAIHKTKHNTEESKTDFRKTTENIDCRISDYLEKKPIEYFRDYLLDENDLMRLPAMDIVTEDSQRCTCFTKGYKRYAKGCGSILQMNNLIKMETEEMKDAMKRSADKDLNADDLRLLRQFQFRYFTPQEIANLHHFPPSFDFPEDTTDGQRYRLLGNSLNVYVVSRIIRLLLGVS